MDEKRDELRTRVLKAETISFANGGAISCVVRNMPSQGATLEWSVKNSQAVDLESGNGILP